MRHSRPFSASERAALLHLIGQLIEHTFLVLRPKQIDLIRSIVGRDAESLNTASLPISPAREAEVHRDELTTTRRILDSLDSLSPSLTCGQAVSLLGCLCHMQAIAGISSEQASRLADLELELTSRLCLHILASPLSAPLHLPTILDTDTVAMLTWLLQRCPIEASPVPDGLSPASLSPPASPGHRLPVGLSAPQLQATTLPDRLPRLVSPSALLAATSFLQNLPEATCLGPDEAGLMSACLNSIQITLDDLSSMGLLTTSVQTDHRSFSCHGPFRPDGLQPPCIAPSELAAVEAVRVRLDKYLTDWEDDKRTREGRVEAEIGCLLAVLASRLGKKIAQAYHASLRRGLEIWLSASANDRFVFNRRTAGDLVNALYVAVTACSGQASQMYSLQSNRSGLTLQAPINLYSVPPAGIRVSVQSLIEQLIKPVDEVSNLPTIIGCSLVIKYLL
ncbi:unnamed protein product [Protopolystoma xenopodis]|uniref:Phosphorylase b kinase regulatory subunit n=1 Tax=Protopolystoma xenopodis TaxID=117903 RepID=A0A448WQQ6_9PLAT|nr:unnamed protein product [Protopolystoma xenopodis]